MKYFVAAVSATLAAGVLADNPPPSYAPAPYQQESYAPASYNYNWAVKDDYSGNDFGQNEERNGDQTSGSYYVLLPDGRRQVVTYSVDAYGGYQADVTYEGEARYPDPKPSKYAPAPAPAYAPAPAPAYNGY